MKLITRIVEDERKVAVDSDNVLSRLLVAHHQIETADSIAQLRQFVAAGSGWRGRDRPILFLLRSFLISSFFFQ